MEPLLQIVHHPKPTGLYHRRHSTFKTYSLENFTFSTFGLMIDFTVKRSGLAIGSLVLYSFILERIMAYYFQTLLSGYVIRNLIDASNSSRIQFFRLNSRQFVDTRYIHWYTGYSVLFVYIVWLF